MRGGGGGGALRQSLHLLRTRLCSQMEPPPQSLHWLRTWLCSQMEPPPHSLQADEVVHAWDPTGA